MVHFDVFIEIYKWNWLNYYQDKNNRDSCKLKVEKKTTIDII